MTSIGTGASRFELLDVLGKGRFGPVYRCVGPDSQPAVAKCYLHPASAQDRDKVRAHYLLESRLLGELTHPCIVSLIDAFEDERCGWIVLEQLDGNLGGFLERYPQPLKRIRAAVARDLLHAVAAIHDLDHVHNDIRPRNVYVRRPRTNVAGRIAFKLGDFGESFALPRRDETKRVGLGGWSHAPEGYDPLRWRPYTKTVDIYKSALVLLSVRLGKTINLTRDEVIGGIAQKLALKARGADSKVLAKALDLEPTRRFQSAEDFLQALEESVRKPTAKD